MKNKVTWLKGTGRFVAASSAGQTIEVTAADGTVTRYETKRSIIATGSVPTTLPGVDLDGEVVVTSTEALSFSEVPKHLAVIGAGVIGLELGSVWSRLGARVTVIEYNGNILAGTDADVARAAQKALADQGFDFVLNARVKTATKKKRGAEVVFEREGSVQTLIVDKVLVSVGRRPFTDGLGLDAVGVQLDARGRVQTNAHFESNVAGIFAIGDVIAGPMLAHKASEEGVAVVEYIVTGYGHVNYDAVPSVVYTHPEIAAVGATEEQLQQKGIAYRKGQFPYMANGRAKALNETTGFVKILADKTTDRILGAHVIGARAGDLIAELVLAIEFKASSEDVARACHAHPTLAEIVKEAALAVDARALHI